MPNPEHIEWLLEGVDNWNRRRNENKFKPDLSGANIYREFEERGMLDNDGFIPLSNFDLSEANMREAIFYSSFTTGGADLRYSNLWRVNLENAQLPNSRLNHAVLRGAKLDGAYLPNAKLCDAKMSNARLYRTDLFKGDLTNAELNLAFLKNASLSCAILDKADLSSATLTGTDLGWSHPWKAKLYRDTDPMSSSYQNVRLDKQINCVADLIEQCNKLDTPKSEIRE